MLVNGSKNLSFELNGRERTRHLQLHSSRPMLRINKLGNILATQSTATTPHRQVHPKEEFDYTIFIAIPVGVFVLIIFIIVLVSICLASFLTSNSPFVF